MYKSQQTLTGTKPIYSVFRYHPIVAIKQTTKVENPSRSTVMSAKSRKRKAKNPLSVARNSNDFFDTLWHKKSGLGFALFVQYYGQQPLGVVTLEDKKSISQTSNIPMIDTCQRSKGMSRAAKRRRRKKEGVKPQQINDDPQCQAKSETVPSSVACKNNLLLDQLEKYPQHERLKEFCTALSKPLPISFRLRDVKQYGSDEQQYTDDLEILKKNLETFKDYARPITSSIYQGTLDKASLSRATFGEKRLKDLLVTASSQGILARQEIGSMLPIFGLVAEKLLRLNAFAIDMCASPGSKTLQLVEKVGLKGKVWANDIHPKRLEALKEALERSGVPLKNRIVLKNCDASKFPASMPRPHVVLADVPCSGDGTIRKDFSILPKWSPRTARYLHALQIKILWRALELVRVGGVVSYSTCSLNPIENEAVVQAVLLKAMERLADEKSPSPLELCNFPNLDKIKLRPGVSEWKVLDYSVQGEDDEIVWTDISRGSDNVPEDWDSTLFPSPDVKELSLERCRRLFPQDNDTGGFFVAFIKKTADF